MLKSAGTVETNGKRSSSGIGGAHLPQQQQPACKKVKTINTAPISHHHRHQGAQVTTALTGDVPRMPPPPPCCWGGFTPIMAPGGPPGQSASYPHSGAAPMPPSEEQLHAASAPPLAAPLKPLRALQQEHQAPGAAAFQPAHLPPQLMGQYCLHQLQQQQHYISYMMHMSWWHHQQIATAAAAAAVPTSTQGASIKPGADSKPPPKRHQSETSGPHLSAAAKAAAECFPGVEGGC